MRIPHPPDYHFSWHFSWPPLIAGIAALLLAFVVMWFFIQP